MKHGKQHWIPKSYLGAWVDPESPSEQEPYVWVFAKGGGPGKKKAPKNIFTETDLYTITGADGARDLSLEHGLSELESRFATIRRESVDRRAELDQEARLILAAFTAAMQARTPRHRHHQQEMWGDVLDTMDQMERAMRAKSPKERAALGRAMSMGSTGGTSLSHDDVRRLATKPLQHAMMPQIETQASLLFQMDIAIISTDDDIGFITTDAPCVWFDPEARSRPFPYNSVGLGFPPVEVTLPVSPTQCLMFNHAGRAGYLKTTRMIVDELNRRHRAHADEHFVVRCNETRPIWFDMGTPPDAHESGVKK